jgi:non-specific serine/threonine protein kinase
MEPDDDKTRGFVMLTKGTMVSHYRIVEKIGAGGMGEVYLAEDTELDRKVALKFLPPHLCQDEDCRARFKREAQAAAKLSHPNIVTIHEVGDHQSRPYFVMEHVEGQSLREFSSAKDLSIEQILELAIQICEGLNDAHEKGVTHRDIKPSNILIDSKIVDFGLASVIGTDQLTKTGSTLGTIGYMSPEQVRGQQMDHRSDLFSLGVVLYELITKQNPFKRDSEAATLKAVSDDMPHPVARYRAGLPDGLQAIVDKALEKDVQTRFQHADGMLSDLMRLKRSLDSTQASATGMSLKQRSRNVWCNVWWVVATAVVIVASVVLITKPWITETASEQPDKIMLAVLPFENLGNPEDEYFADGITGEITARLAQISTLRVISRTSAMTYKNTNKTVSQIGEELGANYVLEGSILWDKSGDTDRVRITPQLIKVDEDFNVWADNIERPLTRLFAVQTDIATHITEALNVTLLERERHVVRTSTEAYDYFMLGISYADRRYELNSARIAVEMFEKAVAIDSSFILGFTNLSRNLSFVYWYHHAEEQVLQRAKVAIDRAAELAPADPMVHEALARYYYHGHRDYERALEEVAYARRLMPDNPEILFTVGSIKRRQGKWSEAVEYFEKSLELNPRSASMAWEIGITYMSIRRYDLAEDWYKRAISLQPDWASPYRELSKLHLLRDGNYAAAYSVLESASPTIDIEELTSEWVQCDKFARNYKSALDRLPAEDYLITRGEIHYLIGDSSRCTAYFDSARIVLEQAGPDGLNFVGKRESRLSITYAHLKRSKDAIRLGQQAMNMNPLSNDAFTGTYRMTDMVETYILLGERERAIDLCEKLLSIPSEISVAYLRGHPIYDPLRDHPCFQALLEKYEKKHGT